MPLQVGDLAHDFELQDTSGKLVNLRDFWSNGPGLPIRRDAPDDPDQENTLATCLITVSKTGIQWRIFDEKEGLAAYQSERKFEKLSMKIQKNIKSLNLQQH